MNTGWKYPLGLREGFAAIKWILMHFAAEDNCGGFEDVVVLVMVVMVMFVLGEGWCWF